MARTMVNARVDTEEKRAADQVLDAAGITWSQAIQALVAYMARTRSFPEALSQPPQEEAERRRRLEAWEALREIGHEVSRAIGPISDAEADQIIYEETMRRHGH